MPRMHHHTIIPLSHTTSEGKPSQAKVRQGCPLMVMVMAMAMVMVLVVAVLAWLLLLG